MGAKAKAVVQPLRKTLLTGACGAVLHDVDLSRGVDETLFQGIHEALMEHGVVFFRDQHITREQHKAFGRLFGELHYHPAAPGPEGHPEILVIHADEKSRYAAGQGWHSDVSCDEAPPMGSILYLKAVPETGGDTLFSNMYTAYEALSDRMKRMLEGMTAIHSGRHVYEGRYNVPKEQMQRDYPESEHPVIRTHPVTGRRALFVNSGFTTRIVGLQPRESRAILDYLFQHVALPDFQCRFNWEPDSIAFWDNRCMQHHAVFDYFPQVRHGERVTVKGDRPYFDPAA
ncbi:MAG TPA: TauD/TfdA family dioxygenase [Pseudomonadales bacterium]